MPACAGFELFIMIGFFSLTVILPVNVTSGEVDRLMAEQVADFFFLLQIFSHADQLAHRGRTCPQAFRLAPRVGACASQCLVATRCWKHGLGTLVAPSGGICC